MVRRRRSAKKRQAVRQHLQACRFFYEAAHLDDMPATDWHISKWFSEFDPLALEIMERAYRFLPSNAIETRNSQTALQAFILSLYQIPQSDSYFQYHVISLLLARIAAEKKD